MQLTEDIRLVHALTRLAKTIFSQLGRENFSRMKGGARRPKSKKNKGGGGVAVTKYEVREQLGHIEHDVYDASSRTVPIEVPASLRQVKAETTGTRYSLSALEREGINAFFVRSLISTTESHQLIDALDAAGWERNDDIKDEYPPDYRSSQRLIVMSDELAANLFGRIINHFREKELLAIKPMGFGADGVWVPVRLNPCFMFSRYAVGQKFSPHFDGHYRDMNNAVSIFSIVLYLNDVPGEDGGRLIFYKGGRHDPTRICTWNPEMGSAAVFQHDVLHEGEELHGNTKYKYVARTSLMFQRVSNLAPAIVSDPSFDKMRSIFAQFDLFRSANDPKLFTQKFLEAQDLQLGGGRTHWKMEPNPFFCTKDVLANVVRKGFIDVRTLCRMSQTCRAWFVICRSGPVWKSLFVREYGDIAAAVVNPLSLPDEACDFYGAFSARTILSTRLSPYVHHVTNFQLVKHRIHQEETDSSRFTYEYDGWDAAVKNWVFSEEGSGDDSYMEFWFGKAWDQSVPEECDDEDFMKKFFHCWICNPPGLLTKLGFDSEVYDRGSYMPELIFQACTTEESRSVLVDVIWPHWYCHSSNDHISEPDWTLVSPISRGREYTLDILRGVERKNNPAGVVLLEVGTAALLAKRRSSGVVLCVSLRGVLISYMYDDQNGLPVPGDVPRTFALESWDDMTTERAIDFVLSSRPHVIMCDIAMNEDLRSGVARGLPSAVTIQRYPFYFLSVVWPLWKQAFEKQSIPVPEFMHQPEMMRGADAFSASEHLSKNFVYVSSKLGGMFRESLLTEFGIPKPKDVCYKYQLGQCWSYGNKCKLVHVRCCPDQVKDGVCPRDRATCPWPHYAQENVPPPDLKAKKR